MSDRLAGRPMDDVLRPEVNIELASALNGWLKDHFERSCWSPLLRRAAARLDMPLKDILKHIDMPLLDLIDQVIGLLHEVRPTNDQRYRSEIDRIRNELRSILADHRSLYTLGYLDPLKQRYGLVTRVSPAVQQAATHVSIMQPGAAGRHLATAWSALHQLHPDVSIAYREAVRAMEAALGPLTLPNAQAPTLGQIKGALISGGLWASVLDRAGPPGKSPAITEATTSSVVFLVDLLERVYGTDARHGEANGHRMQTTAQASAAVYAAVAVLGWAQSGTLVQVPKS